MHERINPVVFPAKAEKGAFVWMEPEVLKLKAEVKNLPEALGLAQLALLLDKEYHAFITHIVSEPVKIAFDDLEMVIFRNDYRDYLKSSGRWPLPKDCLLSGWWADDRDKATADDGEKFNRVADKYLFDLWQECGKPDIAGFTKIIKGLKNHKDKSLIGDCYGSGTRGKSQWTFELVINGAKKTIPYSTLGNKVRDFKKLVNPSE
jgi:hypothetical protein